MIDVVSGDYYFYHFNGLGSVVALSDENGAIVERYEYSAFGQTQILHFEAVSQLHLTNSYFYSATNFSDFL